LLVFFLLVGTHPGRVGASRDLPEHYARFFRALGHRIRSYRTERQLSQEDMISRGFSVRHWQMIEAGRPVNRHTLVTELSESGAGDEVIMSIAGHVSRAMLSRYSHVRMEAKRRALDEIATRQNAADEKRKDDAERREQAAVVPQTEMVQ
jgi:hypothetical protein